jgi:hypothetical protein
MKNQTHTARTFTLGQILSVTTGRLLCKVGDLYDILNYMTGSSIFTHQIPSACEVVAPSIRAQHPALSGITAQEVTPKNWRGWMAAQEITFGAKRALVPLPAGMWPDADPVDGLGRMAGKGKVVVVRTPPA